MEPFTNSSPEHRDNPLVIVRGAGDIASGVIARLKRSGFRLAALEVPHPTVIRRTVSFAQALFDGETRIEDINAKKVSSLAELNTMLLSDTIPILADKDGEVISHLNPLVVVDAIIAKRNMGTHKGMAKLVIGLGPGFEAGNDVHAVIETKRGHDLGRIIEKGRAEENTGIPGVIAGYSSERVIHASCDGFVRPQKSIGDLVEKGDCLMKIDQSDMTAKISGVVRGMIQGGLKVKKGTKIGDVDPRGIKEYCYSISDKAYAIAGGVLETIMRFQNGKFSSLG
jgi:xanthine dehydrogenase accessory factor